MDTLTQVERLIELAIIQRAELKRLVDELPQLREHLNSEIEKIFDEVEPQLRVELEEWAEKKASDSTAKLGNALEAKIAQIAADLQVTTQARFDVLKEQERKLEQLRSEARSELSAQVAILPETVKEIVGAELARFPRAGEIDQLRKEFAEPRGLNPRGKWQAGETYNRLDLVTYNGDSFVSNIDGNTEKPSRNAANWTLNAARGAYGGGGGITSLNDVLNAPTSGQIIGSQNGQYVPKTLVAGANITINETASSITIIGDEGQISLQDGTAAAPSLFFTSDTDTGLYRPAANTLGVAVGGAQIAYFDANGITTVGAGATFDGSVHAANGNANNPSLSFTGDQDTGFFRHQPNEIGIALGGTQYATLTSTTFSITPNLSTSGNLTVSGGKVLLTYPSASQARISFGGAHFDASSSYAAYIRGYSSSATTAGLDFYTTYGSSVLALSLSEQGNATFGGNLTVSGTGTSSVAGSFGIGTTTTEGGSLLHLVKSSAGGEGSFIFLDNPAASTLGSKAGIKFATSNGSSFATSPTGEITNVVTNAGTGASALDFGTFDGSSSATRVRLSATGNLLLGTTTDGGQKLQVAGTAYISSTTTIAGDVSINRGASDTYFSLVTSGTTAGQYILFEDSGGASGSIGYTHSTNALAFKTNGTIGLTLDSSQNATFAGKITNTGELYSSASTFNFYSNTSSSIKLATLENIGSNNTRFNIWNNSSPQVYGLQIETSGTTSVGIRGRNLALNLSSDNGTTTVTNTTASTSTTTGSLVVSGGLGVAGAGFFGGNVQANAVFAANAQTLYLRPSGASVAAGQLSVETNGNATLSGNLTVSGSAASTIEGTLGLNCTPVTWYDNSGSGTALQLGAGAGIYAFNTTGNTQLRLYNNAYLDNVAAERYLTTGEAFAFSALSGEFVWKYASSGTAGNAVTLGRLMSLLGNGNLILGSGSVDSGHKLQVSGTAYVSGRLTTNTGTVVTGGESIATGSGQPIGVQLRYGSVADTAELLAFDWANNGAKNLTLRGTALTLQTGTYGSTTALTLDSSQNATFAGTKMTMNSGAAQSGQRQNLTSSITAAASTVSKKIAYVGPSHSVKVSILAVQDNSVAHVATFSGDFTTSYGSNSTGGTTSAVVGNITAISVAYDNGGAPNYTINVTLTYTGNAPVIYYTIDGHSFNAIAAQ